ncbi:MAG: TerC family protein [Bacteroidetes bacterium]|nr:TerC family protein [Bacteroidota bacterium]
MDIQFTNEALISLGILTILEIVLGIDNIIFVSILASKLPEDRQRYGRRVGLLLGMVIRIIMLMGIDWVRKQEVALFTVMGEGISGKDVMLIIGGLFLLYQSVHEIHLKLKGYKEETKERTSARGISAIFFQMAVLNVVFSLDSVITAIGMANLLWVMIAAVVLSMFVMLAASKPISDFVNKHPSIKILALSFLVMIGVSLIAEGFGQHFNKGYIYFAMAFSFIIELINLRLDKVSTKSHKSS